MKFSEILMKIQSIFIQENEFENVLDKMSTILFRSKCDKHIFTLALWVS